MLMVAISRFKNPKKIPAMPINDKPKATERRSSTLFAKIPYKITPVIAPQPRGIIAKPLSNAL